MKAQPRAVTRLVDRLEKLAEGSDEVTIGDLSQRIGAQGHAPLLMAAALFMISPLGLVPGVGGALGLVVAAVGIQMIAGRDGIWLPAFIRRRTVPARAVRKLADRIRPAANWLRRHLHVRLEPLASGRASLSVIAAILVLIGGALVVVGGIPVAAPIFGLPVAVFALGVLARDGAVVLAGYVLVLLSAGAVAYLGQVL